MLAQEEHADGDKADIVFDDEVIRVRRGTVEWRWKQHLPFHRNHLTDCDPGLKSR